MTALLRQGRIRAKQAAGEAPMRNQEPPDAVVAAFAVRQRRILDADGRPLGPLPAFAEDRDAMLRLYRAMALARAFDVKAIALQRTGQLGTYPSCQGQEAIGVGVASAMADDDVLLTTYREQAAQMWRGVTLVELLQYWSGDERGSDYAGPRRDFPVCVTIAAHAAHAAGVAAAIKLRRQPRVAVCVLGDGATSKGDFYEALNVAGAWRLPLVFVVANNQWAISVPRSRQTAAETLAQKAIAAGFEGVQVDGNDVIAVREQVGLAIERARAGGGPGLVEALTYRLGDHTTADDASRYRPEEEVSAAWAADPIPRLRAYLGGRRWWRKEDEEALAAECRQAVEAAKDAYLALPPEPATAMFDHLHERLPRALEGQRREAAGRTR
jgi:pyruvate dehydrogenase E1 component alpha subunit